MKNWADWFLGVVCYQRNELETAAQYFTQIFENRYIAQISPYRDAVAGLAMIHQVQGENSETWQLAESISQLGAAHPGRGGWLASLCRDAQSAKRVKPRAG